MADDRRQAVVGPAEFALLVKLYNTVATEPWFVSDEAERSRFRRYIIKAFRAGITDPESLTAHCLGIARHHFSTTESSFVER